MASPNKTTDSALLRLDAADNVLIATRNIEPGEMLSFEGISLKIADPIPTGHKLALVPIAAGQKIIKHGLPIGSATIAIQPGQYVHTHNLKSDYLPTYTLESDSRYLSDED